MEVKIINNRPVMIWTPEVEDKAMEQIANLTTLPFLFHHLAMMPDVHTGKGMLFDIYLNPNGTEKKIGAFQFSVSGEGCTITGPTYITYINSSLEYSEGEGVFAYFGGNLNGGVYTFVAAGTAKDQYTVDGKTYDAHIWNATEKTKIVTLKATIDSGANSCKLIVDMESDKRFSVGYDDGTGKGVRPCYTVAVDSKAVSLSGSGALLGDVNGDGKVDARDVLRLRLAVAKRVTLSPAENLVADVNGDNSVDARDVLRLRLFVAKRIPQL